MKVTRSLLAGCLLLGLSMGGVALLAGCDDSKTTGTTVEPTKSAQDQQKAMMDYMQGKKAESKKK